MGSVTSLDGVIVTPLKRIQVPGGDVLHALKISETSFHGFGEAYFSMIEYGKVKAWKRHMKMTLNLIVPIGNILFVMQDGREDSTSYEKQECVAIGVDNYARLTVPPGVWVGFTGLSKDSNLLLNVANMEHDPLEIERAELNKFPYIWNADAISQSEA